MLVKFVALKFLFFPTQVLFICVCTVEPLLLVVFGNCMSGNPERGSCCKVVLRIGCWEGGNLDDVFRVYIINLVVFRDVTLFYVRMNLRKVSDDVHHR